MKIPQIPKFIAPLPGILFLSAFSTPVPHAIILDQESGQVLYEKDAQRPIGPASMTKIMTAYIIFEQLEAGLLNLEDEVTISDNAWKKGGAHTGGSTMFLEPRSKVSVENLLRGVIIQSRNDACIALAEFVDGSEEAFAQRMTRRAHALGLASAQFRNATGWPHPEHRISLADLANLSRLTFQNFPQYYPIYAEKEFTWNGITQPNRNPLLGEFSGADGLKTGYTEESGYALAASATDGDQRRIIVFSGAESKARRKQVALGLMRASLRDFDYKTFVPQGKEVARAKIFLGTRPEAALITETPIRLAYQRSHLSSYSAKITYKEPIKAPVTAGQTVGILQILNSDGAVLQSSNLQIKDDIAKAGYQDRLITGLEFKLLGKFPGATEN